MIIFSISCFTHRPISIQFIFSLSLLKLLIFWPQIRHLEITSFRCIHLNHNLAIHAFLESSNTENTFFQQKCNLITSDTWFDETKIDSWCDITSKSNTNPMSGYKFGNNLRVEAWNRIPAGVVSHFRHEY